MNVSIKDLPYAYYLPSGAPVCVAECPKEDDFSSFFCRYDTAKEIEINANAMVDGGYFPDFDAAVLMQNMEATSAMKCMPYVETRLYMGFCVPAAAVQALTEATSAAVSAHTGITVRRKTKHFINP